jgi:hypothetical protein
LVKFRKRLDRKFPGVSAIWRLEPQRRGAPHFHLILRGDNNRLKHYLTGEKLRRFREWVRVNWTEIADPYGRARKLSNINYLRTEVQIANTPAGCTAYVAKYASKADCDVFVHPRTGQLIQSGRFWGVWRRERIFAAAIQICLTVQQAIELMRLGRRYISRFAPFRWLTDRMSYGMHSLHVIHFVFPQLISRYFSLDFPSVEHTMQT